ncbi:MAG: hypothetical protein NXI24_03450 [bacterium]|nr:hypothetical protein [bacterium]
MTIGGWIIMILSVGGVSAFFGWALTMVLTRKSDPKDRLHSTLDRTPDSD